MPTKALVLVWFALPLVSQVVVNPKTSPEDVAAGGRLYRSHCAECHGLKGEGGRGLDLTLGRFRHGSSDEALLRTIMRGVPGTEMPGIYHQEHQIWQVVSFVRSLSANAEPGDLPGDGGRGGELFSGKGGCAVCHMVNGRGGRHGPDLSDVGGRRSVAHLRRSLAEPSAEVRRTWWPHVATTAAGRRISGTRLNEDTFSIQVLDGGGNLHSLLKAELGEIKVSRESSMPGYGEMLSASELDDLIAYLVSLRRK